MEKNPHLLIEGMHHRRATRPAPTRAFIYIRGEYVAAGRHPRRRASPRPTSAGFLGENILGSGVSLSARRAPRRRRLHLRRGDRRCSTSLEGKRGNPRLKPPFPAEPGPLPGADADQQRRDAVQRAAHHRATAARVVHGDRAPSRSTGTKLVSISGHVQRPGQLRGRARHRRSRDLIYGLAGGPPAGRELKAVIPGGSSAPVLTAERPRPALRLRGAGRRPARCSAPARSSSWTTRRRSCDGRAAGWPSSTATSRAASARPCREGTNWTVKMLERIDAGEATPMDLDIMASVQEQHHRQLPLRARRLDGDARRLDDQEVPRRVRGPHRAARERADPCAATTSRRDLALTEERPPRPMPRPAAEHDHLRDRRPRGRAPEDTMLVDAAKHGDVEIPVLLLRAQARPAGRRVPHVPGGDRGHPEAADRVLDAGQGRHGRPHRRPTA